MQRSTIRFAVWNVNGIRARQAQVQEWIEREQPDVVCLQEIKASPDQVPEALCEMEGYWCYWHGAGLPGAPILDVVRRHRGTIQEAAALLPMRDKPAHLHLPQHGGDCRVGEIAFRFERFMNRAHSRIRMLPENFQNSQLQVAET